MIYIRGYNISTVFVLYSLVLFLLIPFSLSDCPIAYFLWCPPQPQTLLLSYCPVWQKAAQGVGNTWALGAHEHWWRPLSDGAECPWACD